MPATKRFQFKSIRSRMMFWVGLCMVLGIVVITGYGAWDRQRATRQSAEDEVAAQARAEAGLVKAEVEVALDAARTLAQALSAVKTEQTQGLQRDHVNAMLKQVLVSNPNFLGTYTLWEPNAFDGQDAAFANTAGHDATGRFIPYWARSGAGVTFTPLMDYETEGAGDYYLIPKRTQHEAIIKPYLYPIDGVDVLLTSLVVPIVVEGKFYGIAGVDIKLDTLQQMIDSANLYNGQGQLALASYDGIFAAVSNQPELAGQPLKALHQDWEDDLKIIQAGQVVVQEDEGNLAAFAPVHFGNTTTPWAVVVRVPLSYVTAQTVASVWQMVAVGVAAALAALAVLWFITRQLTAPLKIITGALENLRMGDLNRDTDQRVKEAIMGRADEIGLMGQGLGQTEGYLMEIAANADRIASGDLTVTIAPRSDKDELGAAFAHMAANLRQMVGQIINTAGGLNEASGQLSSASEQAGQAVSQMASTIQQVATGTANQSEGIGAVMAAMEQMSRAIEGVAQGAQEQAKAIGRSTEVTARMSEAIDQVAANVTKLETVREKVGLSTRKVNEMGRRSQQIGAIVKTIDDIAAQTNLLALNAAIEAARAGEHGKGFAVVADEVRKLAEKSASATKEIAELIHNVQAVAGEAVTAMEESAAGVDAQVEQISQATRAMSLSSNELVQVMETVSAVVEENTASTEELSAGAMEVGDIMQGVASVSEENSASAQEVSASTEEMSAQVQEVSASAQELRGMAQMLQSLVDQYKLDGR